MTEEIRYARKLARALGSDIRKNKKVSELMDYLVEQPGGEELIQIAILQDIIRSSEEKEGTILFPELRKAVDEVLTEQAQVKKDGLGQWDVVGNIVGTLTQAGASIYGAKLQAKAQEDIAKIEAQARQAEARAVEAQAEAKKKEAEAQLAAVLAQIEATKKTVSPDIEPKAPTGPSALPAGIFDGEFSILPVALIGGGILLYMLFGQQSSESKGKE